MSETARSVCSVVGEAGTDHQRAGIELLDLVVGDAQHLGVGLRIGRGVAPLA